MLMMEAILFTVSTSSGMYDNDVPSLDGHRTGTTQSLTTAKPIVDGHLRHRFAVVGGSERLAIVQDLDQLVLAQVFDALLNDLIHALLPGHVLPQLIDPIMLGILLDALVQKRAVQPLPREIVRDEDI
jgi:hypothetical protein